MEKKRRITIEQMAESGECACSTCSSQDTVDNFEQVGRKNFTQLALLALEIAQTESKRS